MDVPAASGRAPLAPAPAPATIWLTGISASGKSTLSRALRDALGAAGIAGVTVVDGEQVRARLSNHFGHGVADRLAVLDHIIEAAAAANRDGVVAVVATISHQRRMRARARARLPRFMEVFLDCPPDVCAARDDKGNYARARRGETGPFVGVDLEYERSEAADLVLDTATMTVEESARRLLDASLEFLRSGTG